MVQIEDATIEESHWSVVQHHEAYYRDGKRKFVPRDQASPLLVVYCSLQLRVDRYVRIDSIHKDCCKLFLLVHFAFWKFLNFNLTFGVCRKGNLFLTEVNGFMLSKGTWSINAMLNLSFLKYHKPWMIIFLSFLLWIIR